MQNQGLFRYIAKTAVVLLLLHGALSISNAAAQDLPPFNPNELRAMLRDDPAAGRERALAYMENELDPESIEYSHAARIVSISYGMEARYKEALPYAELSYNVAKLTGRPQTIARTLHNIGTVHRLSGNLAEAIDIYRESIETARGQGANDVLVVALANQSELLISYGATTQGLELAEEAATLLEYTSNSSVHASLAHAFSLNGRYEKAKEMLDLGRTLFPPGEPKELTALYAFQEALAADGMDNRVEAEQHIDRCLKATADLNVPLPTMNCLDYGARFALDRGNIANARQLIDDLAALQSQEEREASTTVFPADADRLKSNLLDLRIIFSLKTGDTRQALALRKERAEVEQSMAETRQRFDLALVSAEFADRIRDARLQDLEQEASVMALEAERQRFLVLGSLALACILGFGAIMFYRTAQERRQLNATLANSLEMQTVLAKDVQHRAKNNLQLLISTLNLQRRHASGDGKDTKALVSQMQAMALLHDLLYAEGGEATHVDAKAYLVPLVGAIAQSHQGERQIEILSVDPVMLDTAIASTLGFIVTELLSNAFKHAPGAMIRVSLQDLSNNRFRLKVEDDGPGFGENVRQNPTTLGLVLVDDLTKQLNGEINREGAIGNGGTRWVLNAPTTLVPESQPTASRSQLYPDHVTH